MKAPISRSWDRLPFVRPFSRSLKPESRASAISQLRLSQKSGGKPIGRRYRSMFPPMASSIAGMPPGRYQSLIDVGFGEVHAVYKSGREEATFVAPTKAQNRPRFVPSRGRSIIRRDIYREEDRGTNFPCRFPTGRRTSRLRVFQERRRAYRVLLPFIKDGFERGDKATHVVNPGQHHDHLQRLAAADIDAEAARRSGQFELRTNTETYLRSGQDAGVFRAVGERQQEQWISAQSHRLPDGMGG